LTLNNYTDNGLFQLVAQGDEAAFTVLYDRYWDKLFAVAANQLGDLAVAEELVQDVLLDLWQRRATIQLTGELQAYLAVAMKYRVINVQVRRKKFREYQQAAGQPVADNSTEQWLGFEELREQLAALVNRLPERSRLAYQLSREQGLSQKEIARTMNISEKAVEHNLARAIKSLREGLRHFFKLMVSL
jgi:RNA polymerase sigma-70 factor (ECF subfamily)